MKVNYKPSGPSRPNAPKQWEVWLADAEFGGVKKRCSVVVAKRTPAGCTVYEIVSLSVKSAKDVLISDLMRAGQDKPGAVRVNPSAVIQVKDFVQKLGTITEADVSKIISARQ